MLNQHTRNRRNRLRVERLEDRRLLTAGPWTNPLNALDVNNDQDVTARDALAIVNQLPRVDSPDAAEEVPPILGGPSFHFDVTGDRQVTALDVLRVINFLDRGQGEASQPVIPTRDDPTPHARATDLAFTDDYAIGFGALSQSNDHDRFAFEAEQGFVAIDLSSLGDESKAEVRVLDESGVELARGSQVRSRREFEGIKLPVVAGRTYQVVVEQAGDPSVELAYALSVFQFDLEQWPGVNLFGHEWRNHLGPDSEFGDDIHADVPEDATLIRLFERRAHFSSHIDAADDIDWFRVPLTGNAIVFGVGGTDGAQVVFEVLDASGNQPLVPITSISTGGNLDAGTYPVQDVAELLVRVQGRSGSVGQFHFSLTDSGFIPPPPGTSTPLNLEDQVGNTFADAADIAISTDRTVQFTQALETSDDVDVFRIPNALPGTAVVLGIDGITAELFDAAGNLMEPMDPTVSGVDTLSFRRYGSLLSIGDANPFVYLRVSSDNGSTGHYSVFVGFTGDIPGPIEGFEPFDVIAAADRPDSRFGDDPHGATPPTSTLHRAEDRPTSRTSFLDSPDDIDVFSLRLWGAVTVSVQSENITGLRLRVLGRDGVELTPLITMSNDQSYGLTINTKDAPEYVDSQGNTRKAGYLEVSSDDGSVGQYKLFVAVQRSVVQPLMSLEEQSLFDEETARLSNSRVVDEDGKIVSIAPLEDSIAADLIRRRFNAMLRSPRDTDSFYFTAKHSQLSITMNRQDGFVPPLEEKFNVYDENAELVEPDSVQDHDVDGNTSALITKTYTFEVGKTYAVLTIEKMPW